MSTMHHCNEIHRLTCSLAEPQLQVTQSVQVLLPNTTQVTGAIKLSSTPDNMAFKSHSTYVSEFPLTTAESEQSSTHRSPAISSRPYTVSHNSKVIFHSATFRSMS